MEAEESALDTSYNKFGKNAQNTQDGLASGINKNTTGIKHSDMLSQMLERNEYGQAGGGRR